MEIERIIEGYYVGKTLGEGAFGKVKQGKKLESDEEYALKFFVKKDNPKKEAIVIRKELDIQANLCHPNIV